MINVLNQVVDKLDRFIIGQTDAKRAVAIALRNRWRRHQLGDDMRNEVRENRFIFRKLFA